MSRTYEVQAGDSLSKIAQQQDVSLDKLIAANPQIGNPNLIITGQRLNLPDGDRIGNAQLQHQVSRGETLSSIGQRYGVSAQALAAANPQLSNPNLIYPGDSLRVPAADVGGDAARTHVVRSGETLSEIGAQYGVSAGAIARTNDIRNPDLIYPGDVLVIPGAAGSTPPRETTPVTTDPADPAPVTDGQNPAPPAAGEFDYDQIAGVRGNANVTPAFIAEVEAMAQRLDTRPEYIMAVMSFETGGSFSPRANNPSTDATGLIQFLPSTARGLGTSVEALRGMSATEQLRHVEAYFNQYEGQLGTLEGVYTSVLSGRARPNPSDTLFSSGSEAYRLNSGLDYNRDGSVTSGEATSAVASRLYGGVSAVQQQLVDRGQVPENQRAGFVDGDFGPNTSAAIRRFQQAEGLTATGLLDDATGRALFASDAPATQTPAPAGEIPTYNPYTVYATGGGTVQISDPSQLRAHHDYQTKVREGQTLEVRDVTIAHPGESQNAQRIPSPVAGTVVSAGPLGNAGNAVILRGDDGGLVYLFHMSRVDVRAGDTVRYGESVGLQGSTGNSSGPHVHIEAAPQTIRNWVGDLLDGRFDARH